MSNTLFNNNLIPLRAKVVTGQRVVRVKGSKIWMPVGVGGDTSQIISYIENGPNNPNSNIFNEWEIKATNIYNGFGEPFNAFANDLGSINLNQWSGNNSNAILTWKNNKKKVLIQAYRLKSNYSNNLGTTSWVLEGSDDGNNWTIIDERNGVSLNINGAVLYECFNNKTSYYYHRIRVVSCDTYAYINLLKTYQLNIKGTSATPDKILNGETAFSNTGIIVGNIPTIEPINDGVTLTIPKGYNDEEKQYTIGIDTSDATAIASEIILGKSAYVNGQKIDGTMPLSTPSFNGNIVFIPTGFVSETIIKNIGLSISSTEIMPSTENQTIKANSYLIEDVTILGDNNLNSGNIKKGISIFGVEGALTDNGIDTSDATATSKDIVKGKSAYSQGLKINGNYSSKKEIKKALLIFGN